MVVGGRNSMKRTVLVLLGFAGIISASPVLCPSNSIAYYQANYTSSSTACQVGDKLFYGFTYSPTSFPDTVVAPQGTQVFVNGDPSNPNEPGLIFSSSGWTLTGASLASVIFIDATITFSISTVDGRPLIVDSSLSFDQQVTGLGQTQVGETVTPQGQSSFNLTVTSAGPFSDVGSFPGVSTVSVSKDLLVRIPKGADSTSTATITSFREGFSETPEPTNFVLMGSSLLGVALLLRRRQNNLHQRMSNRRRFRL
jgi:hypothetical protein